MRQCLWGSSRGRSVPVCAGGGSDLIGVHKMCADSTYLMRRWEMYDDPTVAPRCKIEAMRTRCPMVGVGRQVRCSMPIQRCRVMEGVVGVGAMRIRYRPPLSEAVPRSIQNWPACRQWCSSEGHCGGEGEELRDDTCGEPLARSARPVPGKGPPVEETSILEGDKGSTLWPRVEKEGAGDVKHGEVHTFLRDERLCATAVVPEATPPTSEKGRRTRCSRKSLCCRSPWQPCP